MGWAHHLEIIMHINTNHTIGGGLMKLKMHKEPRMLVHAFLLHSEAKPFISHNRWAEYQMVRQFRYAQIYTNFLLVLDLLAQV
jgi:hypothetical protein